MMECAWDLMEGSRILQFPASGYGDTTVGLSPVLMRVHHPDVGNRYKFLVRATKAAVFVDPSEAEKSQRLRFSYKERILPQMKEEFAYKNIHQVPKLEKIVVSSSIWDGSQNEKSLDALMNDVALITGQKPVKTKAKKSVAKYRITKGHITGIFVTLRRKIMYFFLDRLINLVLPMTKDFRGVNPSGLNGRGSLGICVPDINAFPEIQYKPLSKARGVNICICTTAKTNKECQWLLEQMGMPFQTPKPKPSNINEDDDQSSSTTHILNSPVTQSG